MPQLPLLLLPILRRRLWPLQLRIRSPKRACSIQPQLKSREPSWQVLIPCLDCLRRSLKFRCGHTHLPRSVSGVSVSEVSADMQIGCAVDPASRWRVLPFWWRRSGQVHISYTTRNDCTNLVIEKPNLAIWCVAVTTIWEQKPG